MRVCLLIEGQECVTWDEWVGVSRLFLQHLDHCDLESVAVMGEIARGSGR
jgi:hypothetical protein